MSWIKDEQNKYSKSLNERLIEMDKEFWEEWQKKRREDAILYMTNTSFQTTIGTIKI